MLLGEAVKVNLWRIVLSGSALAMLLAWFAGSLVQQYWQQQQALSSYHEMSALRVVSEPGKAGTVFWGDADIFADTASVRMPIVLPHGTQWELGWRQSQALGHLLQQCVTCLVTIGVIDRFEFVQIQKEYGQGAMSATGSYDGLLQSLCHQGAVGQAGDR